MPCWVVPAVASEIWHVPVDQILAAVRAGQLPSKQENGFTFVDVAPQSGSAPATPGPKKPVQRPISYKVVRSQRQGNEPIPLPRPAEIVTPVEVEGLHGDHGPSCGGDEPLSMGDWRRGRRTAAARRIGPAEPMPQRRAS
jgi:hypothetical protein